MWYHSAGTRGVGISSVVFPEAIVADLEVRPRRRVLRHRHLFPRFLQRFPQGGLGVPYDSAHETNRRIRFEVGHIGRRRQVSVGLGKLLDVLVEVLMHARSEEPADIATAIEPRNRSNASAPGEVGVKLMKRAPDPRHRLSALRIQPPALDKDLHDVLGNLGCKTPQKILFQTPRGNGEIGHAG